MRVWSSTLEGLKRHQFDSSDFSDEKSFHDKVIALTPVQNGRIDDFFNNLAYPSCAVCQKKVCANGRNTCQCSNNQHYQQEYQYLQEKIVEAERAIQALADAPFRQSRNAYGFLSSTITGGNLFLTYAVHAAFAVSCALLIGPPVLLSAYVYYRGRKEEEKINAELQADWLDRKMTLLCKHNESVSLRVQKKVPDFKLYDASTPKIKPFKEKRGLIGNPTSHFVVSSIATTSMVVTALKIGLVAAIVTVSGPVAWGIAVGLGFAVGCYFAYKRYQFLSRKITAEVKMAELLAMDVKLTGSTALSSSEKVKPKQLERSSSCPDFFKKSDLLGAQTLVSTAQPVLS